MEGWEKDHIKKNLADLIRLTKINKGIEADLLAEDIIDDSDIKELVIKYFVV